LLEAQAKALGLCQSHQRPGTSRGGRHIAAVLGEDSGSNLRQRATREMVHLLGQGQHRLTALLSLVRIS
jgi:hypothetical protein